jgi:hypothetical protein
MFSDEATFHVSGHVHRNNVRIWANGGPHDFVEHKRDSLKVNVWCALFRYLVIGPYFFAKRTVTSHNYLDMLEPFAVPQIDDDKMVLLCTMPTSLRNFLMRLFHGAGLGGADGRNGPHGLRTWHSWILISGVMWSKSSAVFVLTTFNIWHNEPEKMPHLLLLMFLSTEAGNGIPLTCLQSHQWSPNVTSINTWKKLFEFFFDLTHV